MTYLPVQELVQITQMIHSERERTAEVERELKQVQRLSRASDHELRVAKEEALQELTRVQNFALAQKIKSVCLLLQYKRPCKMVDGAGLPPVLRLCRLRKGMQ